MEEEYFTILIPKKYSMTVENLKNGLKFGEKAIYGGRIFYYSDPEKI